MRTLCALSVLVVASFLLVAPAAAQRGPAPGADPVGYATGHYTGLAGEAAADPVGFASDAGPATVGTESDEAGYIACWAAFDATGQVPPGCEMFFTAPQEPGPVGQDPEAANGTTQEAEAVAGAVSDGAGELATEAQEAVATIVEDPTQAPGALEAFAAAVAAFAGGILGAVWGALKAAGIAFVFLGGLGLQGLQLAGLGLLDALGGVATLAVAFTDGLGAGLGALGLAGQGLGTLALAAGPAAGGAFASVGQVVADGARAAGSAVVDGATAAAQAVASGVASVAQAVADGAVAAAQAVGDAVASLFGAGSEAPAADAPAAAPLLKEAPVDTSLLDGVLDAVPA